MCNKTTPSNLRPGKQTPRKHKPRKAFFLHRHSKIYYIFLYIGPGVALYNIIFKTSEGKSFFEHAMVITITYNPENRNLLAILNKKYVAASISFYAKLVTECIVNYNN